MTGMIGSPFSTILVALLCTTTVLRLCLAEASVTPPLPSIPGSPIDLTKCWSAILNIQGCETEIFKSALTGKFENICPACCKVFTEIDAMCWPKMFPLNPLFPPLLKDSCAHISAASPEHTTNKFAVSRIDLTKCLSSLVNVQGCVGEIYKSVLTGQFGNVGPMCCKAFSVMDAKCWPQIFPLNPFFPPLLRNECSRINAVAPTHK